MTKVIAHRGASAERPEQTRAAYELAVAQGADGVECDVRLTADGEVVCFHDATTDRTLGTPGVIAELTLDELRELGAVLTLGELVALLRDARRPVILAIELKHPNPFGLDLEPAVLQVLASNDLGQVAPSLMSFNPLSVGALAPTDPAGIMILTADLAIDDITGELDPSQSADAAAASELAAALAGGLHLIDAGIVGGAGPDVDFCRAHPDRVTGWIGAGRTVRVWTADAPADIDFLVGLGVQEITTNTPAAALRHLQENR